MNKIIIVDDHSLFREGLKLLIENEGFGQVIAEAENGLVFLKQLAANRPDLVIMDIEMPVMGGLEATKQALMLYPDLKILVVTMLTEKESYFDLLNAGAMGFVLKTAGKTEFEKAINALRNGESYFSNDLLRQIISNKALRKTEDLEQNERNKIKLTARESEILELFCKGKTVTEIAEKLFLSPKTIEAHRSTLLRKTDAKNTINLILYAIKNKLVNF